MVIYNTTIKVEAAIDTDWMRWLKTEYLPAVMETGLFLSYRICRLLETNPDEDRTYVIQYSLASQSSFQQYEGLYAETLEALAEKRFGTRCLIFRTLMEVMD
jgi:hypothetical protein